MKTVLFLCTGNYYRSRFAEILFNWHATQQELNWRADSRGLALFSDNLGAREATISSKIIVVRVDDKTFIKT